MVATLIAALVLHLVGSLNLAWGADEEQNSGLELGCFILSPMDAEFIEEDLFPIHQQVSSSIENSGFKDIPQGISPEAKYGKLSLGCGTELEYVLFPADDPYMEPYAPNTYTVIFDENGDKSLAGDLQIANLFTP